MDRKGFIYAIGSSSNHSDTSKKGYEHLSSNECVLPITYHRNGNRGHIHINITYNQLSDQTPIFPDPDFI